MVKGIAEGCRQAGCALIGGETAELPGFYATGRVRPRRLRGRGAWSARASWTGARVAPGDVVVGIASSGLHSNGYSLARKALLEKHALDATLRRARREDARRRAPRADPHLREGRARAPRGRAGEGVRPRHRRRPPRERAAHPARRHARGPRRAALAAAADLRPRRARGRRVARRDVPDLQHGPRARRGRRPRRRGGARTRRSARRGLEAWTVGADRARRGRGHLRGGARDPPRRPRVGRRHEPPGAPRRAAPRGGSTPRSRSSLSNVPGAGALERARAARRRDRGAPVEGASPIARRTTARLVERCAAHGVELVCLAGYMRLVTPRVPARVRGRRPRRAAARAS